MVRDMEIKVMPIQELAPAPYNPRAISPEALAGLRGSVERFGLVEPVVWNRRTGHVVGGHQRLKVLQQLGENETQVVVVDLEEAEEKALNVALNNPAIAGEFTADIHVLLAEINAAMPELSRPAAVRRPGRPDQEAAGRAFAQRGPDRPRRRARGARGADHPARRPDAPGPAPAHLRRQRRSCGPCAPDGRPDGQAVRHRPALRRRLRRHQPSPEPARQGRRPGAREPEPRLVRRLRGPRRLGSLRGSAAEFERFLERIFLRAMPHVANDAAWYCWHASRDRRAASGGPGKSAGIRYHQMITWVKPTFVLGFAMWNYRTEPCLMGWQQGHKPAAYPGRRTRQSNVWEVDWEGKARCTDGQHPDPEAGPAVRAADAQAHPPRRYLPGDVRRQRHPR